MKIICTLEHKEKLRRINSHPCTDEHKRQISIANSRPCREETKAQIRATKANKSSEIKAQISAKLSGPNNGMFGKPSTFQGKHHTDKAKQIQREKKLGKHQTPEHIQKRVNSVNRYHEKRRALLKASSDVHKAKQLLFSQFTNTLSCYIFAFWISEIPYVVEQKPPCSSEVIFFCNTSLLLPSAALTMVAALGWGTWRPIVRSYNSMSKSRPK